MAFATANSKLAAADMLRRRPVAASPTTHVTETLYYRPPAKIASQKSAMRFNALVDTTTISLQVYTYMTNPTTTRLSYTFLIYFSPLGQLEKRLHLSTILHYQKHKIG